MKTVVVTGYKPMEMGIFKTNDHKIDFVKETIKRRLLSLIDDGLEWVLISGQMGVELWAGQVVLDLKEMDLPVRLGVIPPFQNQEERWPEDIQMMYEELTIAADFFKPVFNKEYDGPYQFRAKDQFLIKHSDGSLVLFDEDTDGSPKFFLNQAKEEQEKNKYKVIYITPMDLEETVEELRMTDPDYWSQ